LPSGDFNRRVYQFDDSRAIWDQKDYEERVKVEAEMLVALEALKESLSYAAYDVHDLGQSIQTQFERISDNAMDIYENLAFATKTFGETETRVHDLQDRCHHTQAELNDNKDTLILYCQQFAFAPEMVPQCAQVLTHKLCQVDQRYFSYGNQSTHGIELHHTGGHVEPANPYTDPELAAASVTPYDAVI